MGRNRAHRRLLIYSHDSFGLGHLRRCRAIAHALVDHRRDLSVLILSGSPIIGSFSFRNRVDFVRVPGVIKLRHGDYTSLSLDIGIEETLALRTSIIRHTAEVFDPDIFLVDKEPLGLRGEVKDTLIMLKARGTPLVLGLRDVMDDPGHLSEEWRRKGAVPALSELYDHIWVYGLPEICDPLQGVRLPAAVTAKMRYTGYLRRTGGVAGSPPSQPQSIGGEPYLLVTTGGGGDGAALIDWVLRAYEHDRDIPHPALLVLGPFMRSALQGEFMDRVNRLDKVEAITFDAMIEDLMVGAAGIVAMGGYNTFCEILSFDKPALIVPRTVPRVEQYIRAARAQELGLARMLAAAGERDPQRMAAALRDLPTQPRPSEVRIAGLLDGLSVIAGMVDQWLTPSAEAATRLSLVTRGS
ncbi:MAG: glycosyltransferase family protein [Rhodospirillales bacterium]